MRREGRESEETIGGGERGGLGGIKEEWAVGRWTG